MAAMKSNGVSGGERRRRSRATNGVGPTPGGGGDADGWLGRLDALVDRLAGLDDRDAIIDQVVAEAMQLLSADEVRVYADASTITAASFADESEGAPARAVIPLAIAGRHFGAVEITMKPQRAISASQRALAVVMARQCALALEGLALRQARRADDVAPAVAADVAPAVVEMPPAVPAAPVVEIAPAAVAAPIVEIAAATAQAGGPNVAAVQAALGRLEADVRALAKLARNAELPPAAWVDRAELKVLRGLDETRSLLMPGVENAA